ncbi:unnamed protein product [Choristocarpus tenellus]
MGEEVDRTGTLVPDGRQDVPIPKVGVLAIQGAFVEHSVQLRHLGADVIEVRLPEHFNDLDGIIIPGGESTAMALIGERWGVFPRLKSWVNDGRPTWGTCAGMILLSDHALMTKQGGQSLVGGLDVEVCRNYFGAQSSSFEIPLDTALLNLGAGSQSVTAKEYKPYPAVFIRAPAILEVIYKAAGPGVDVLCKVRARPCNKARSSMQAILQEGKILGEADECSSNGEVQSEEERSAKRRKLLEFFSEPPTDGLARGGQAGMMEKESGELPEVIVAVQKGNILATAFHPELTDDARWHQHFMTMVQGYQAKARGAPVEAPVSDVKISSA